MLILIKQVYERLQVKYPQHKRMFTGAKIQTRVPETQTFSDRT